jgi:hypothetical protein
MHRARVRARSIADHLRSNPGNQTVIRVEDTDTYLLYAAALDLETHRSQEEACRVADARQLLAELYGRDGMAIDSTTLDTQAEDVAAQERADRFLLEIQARIQPDAELLELAGQLDDHALGVWLEAAASLVDDCPPSYLHVQGRVEEERRGELRGHAHLLRTEAALGAAFGRFSLGARLWNRRKVAELRSKLTTNGTLRHRSEERLAFLDAKLSVIDRAEQARLSWLADAHDELARGLAAAQVLAGRQQQADTVELDGLSAGTATEADSVWPRQAS